MSATVSISVNINVNEKSANPIDVDGDGLNDIVSVSADSSGPGGAVTGRVTIALAKDKFHSDKVIRGTFSEAGVDESVGNKIRFGGQIDPAAIAKKVYGESSQVVKQKQHLDKEIAENGGVLGALRDDSQLDSVLAARGGASGDDLGTVRRDATDGVYAPPTSSWVALKLSPQDTSLEEATLSHRNGDLRSRLAGTKGDITYRLYMTYRGNTVEVVKNDLAGKGASEAAASLTRALESMVLSKSTSAKVMTITISAENGISVIKK